MSATDSRLPEAAEQLLDGWPAPARSALEWEQSATVILERVQSTNIGATPDDLLEAPLPPESGEPAFADANGAEEPGLASIARAAIAGGAPVVSNDVARDMMSIAEQGRQASPKNWSAPSNAARPAPAEREGVARRRFEPVPAEARVHPQETVAHSEFPRSQREERRPGFAAGMLGGAALAFAAAAAMYVTVRQHDGNPVTAAPPSESVQASAPASPPVAPVPATPAARGAAEPSALTLDQLPAASPSPGSDKPAASAAPSDQSLSFHVRRSSKDKLTLEERADNSPPALAQEPPEPVAPTAAAPSKSAGAAAQNDDGANEPVTAQPSVGAVQAAIGSVMVGARSCVAGQEQGSRAQLTFGGDGRVRSVAVTGPAAGTPAEACLRSALMSARIPPFSGPSFTAGLTVRPP